MARKRSYMAKSNRNNILGTVAHNYFVDREQERKKDATTAARKKREAERRVKTQAAEAVKREKDAERRNKQLERERIKAEKDRGKELKRLEVEKKKQELENDRYKKYEAKFELYCKKYQLDPICSNLMAKEALDAGLRLGKELEDLIVLGREGEWKEKAAKLRSIERKDLLVHTINSWIKEQGLYKHKSIDILVNDLRRVLESSMLPIDGILESDLALAQIDKIRGQNTYLYAVEENAKGAITEFNILPEYKDDFIEMLISFRVKPDAIWECQTTQNFALRSKKDRKKRYMVTINTLAEKLLQEDKILEMEIDELRDDLIAASLDINSLDDNQIVCRYTENRKRYEEELDVRIQAHLS